MQKKEQIQNDDQSFVNESDFICPHCGKNKEKIDHYCYSIWMGGYSSDLRHNAP